MSTKSITEPQLIGRNPEGETCWCPFRSRDSVGGGSGASHWRWSGLDQDPSARRSWKPTRDAQEARIRGFVCSASGVATWICTKATVVCQERKSARAVQRSYTRWASVRQTVGTPVQSFVDCRIQPCGQLSSWNGGSRTAVPWTGLP